MKTAVKIGTYEPSFLRELGKEEREEAEAIVKKWQIIYFEGGWEVSLDIDRMGHSTYHRCAHLMEWAEDSDDRYDDIQDYLLTVSVTTEGINGKEYCQGCDVRAPEIAVQLAELLCL